MKAAYARDREKLHSNKGISLVEIMIAFAVFTILGTVIATTVIANRKVIEGGIYQAEAETVAQSIMEQVQLMTFDALSDTSASPPPVSLKFMAATSTGGAVVQDFSLDWAPDATTFTPVGEVSGTFVKGVLLDVDYIYGGQTLRNRRYMNMSVNLSRQVDTANKHVEITLTYRWVIPDRKTSSGGNVTLSREIRTVRSAVESD